MKKFKGVLFDKNTRSSELLFNFYECCYKFLPRAQPQDKIDSYNSALQAFSIFCSSTLTHNNIGFDFKLFPEVKLSGEHLETVFKYKNGDDVREIAKINITLQKKRVVYIIYVDWILRDASFLDRTSVTMILNM